MTLRSSEEMRKIVLDALGGIAPEMDPESIAADLPLREQVDIDSFDFLNMVIHLHETLGIDIPEKDYAELRTLNSTVEYLVRRRAAQQ